MNYISKNKKDSWLNGPRAVERLGLKTQQRESGHRDDIYNEGTQRRIEMSHREGTW